MKNFRFVFLLQTETFIWKPMNHWNQTRSSCSRAWCNVALLFCRLPAPQLATMWSLFVFFFLLSSHRSGISMDCEMPQEDFSRLSATLVRKCKVNSNGHETRSFFPRLIERNAQHGENFSPHSERKQKRIAYKRSSRRVRGPWSSVLLAFGAANLLFFGRATN